MEFKLFFAAGLLLTQQALAQDAADVIPPSIPESIELISYVDDRINLRWIGSGDDGWDGKAASYKVKSSQSPVVNESQWQAAVEMKLEYTNGANSKRVSAFTTGTKLGDFGYITIRAEDEAGNLSELVQSLSFNIVNPYTEIAIALTKVQADGQAMGNEAAGEALYGCISQVDKDLVPGKFGSHLGDCLIARDGKEVGGAGFRIIAKNAAYKWNPQNAAAVPLKTGRISGKNAFTCRATVERGLHLGYFQEGTGCTVSYGGATRILTAFEFLSL